MSKKQAVRRVPKRLRAFTELYGVTSQKTVVVLFTAVASQSSTSYDFIDLKKTGVIDDQYQCDSYVDYW
jgi:hypothetical protein